MESERWQKQVVAEGPCILLLRHLSRRLYQWLQCDEWLRQFEEWMLYTRDESVKPKYS